MTRHDLNAPRRNCQLLVPLLLVAAWMAGCRSRLDDLVINPQTSDSGEDFDEATDSPDAGAPDRESGDDAGTGGGSTDAGDTEPDADTDMISDSDSDSGGAGGTSSGGGGGGGAAPMQGGAGGDDASAAGAGGEMAAGGSGGTVAEMDAGTDPPEPYPFTLVSSSPSAGAYDVDTAAHVVLTFDRDIDVLSGDVSVYRSVDDTPFESASLTSSRVTVSGATLTFDLDGILAGDSTYYITLDAEAIEAADGDIFGGLDKSSNLSFGTAPATPPGSVADGLTLWLDASFDASLKTTGTDVSVWGDRSGNNYTVRPRLVDTEPEWIAAAINDLPVVRFDGINHALEGPVIPAFTEYDLFIVWQSSILPQTNVHTHLLQSGQNLEVNHSHPVEAFRHASGSNFEPAWVPVSFTAPESNTPYLWNVNFDPSTDTMTSFTNGAQSDTTTGLTDTPSSTVEPLTLATGYDKERFFTGDIAEIVVYDRALDSSERADVQSYLMSKWGI